MAWYLWVLMVASLVWAALGIYARSSTSVEEEKTAAIQQIVWGFVIAIGAGFGAYLLGKKEMPAAQKTEMVVAADVSEELQKIGVRLGEIGQKLGTAVHVAEESMNKN